MVILNSYILYLQLYLLVVIGVTIEITVEGNHKEEYTCVLLIGIILHPIPFNATLSVKIILCKISIATKIYFTLFSLQI